MDYSGLSFEQLWQRVADSDDKAIAEIVQRFNPKIIRLSQINGHLDDDAMQDIRETFVRAIKRYKFVRQNTEAR